MSDNITAKLLQVINVSARDNNAGYLLEKLVAGENVALSVVDPASDGNLKLKIDASGGGESPIVVDGNDITIGDNGDTVIFPGNLKLSSANGTRPSYTINALSGKVQAIGAGINSVTVNNSFVTADSLIFATVNTNLTGVEAPRIKSARAEVNFGVPQMKFQLEPTAAIPWSFNFLVINPA